MRYAVIDESGRVVNVIEAPAGWSAPSGHRVHASDVASPGDTWDGQAVIPAAVPDVPEREPQEPRGSLLQRYQAAATAEEQLAILAEALGLEQ